MSQETVVSPPLVPLEYGGKWIAWDHDRTKIVGSGQTLFEARDAANKAGEARPFLTKAPHPTIRFAGGAR